MNYKYKIKLKLIKGILSYIFENEENKFLIPFRFFCVLFWQFWKRTISLPIILRLGNGIKYYADPFAGNATGAIYVSTYEKKYINFLRKNISLKTSKWIDVGSNSGLFAMWFADILSKGYLFEPTPDLYRLLNINIQINQLEKYEIFNLACSEKKQPLKLVVTGKLSGDNRILDNKNITNSASLIDVESISIDDLSLMNGIDFLKIDTEGSELLILEGARNTLLESRNAIALIENNNFQELYEFFRDIGWKIFDINSQGKIILENEKLKKAYNLICIGPDHPLYKRIIIY